MASRQAVTPKTPPPADQPASAPMTVDKWTPGRSHGLIAQMSAKYGIDSDKMLETLKQTAFRQRSKGNEGSVVVSNEQMMMLLVIAHEYNLNPFTREIYAFPSENGIIAIVSVDGWIRIVNERPELDSIEFEVAPGGTEDPWISCTITRKDRSKPVTITEYLSECARDTGPWNSHPRRMLRHKALIQCARVAFGFAGVFDPDEADRIVATIEAGAATPREATTPPKRKALPDTPAEPPAKEKDPVPRVTLDQATALADKLSSEGVELAELLQVFKIETLEDLPAASYEAAIQAIDNLSSSG